MAYNWKPLVSSSNPTGGAWCDLGFVPKRRGNNAAENLRFFFAVTRTDTPMRTIAATAPEDGKRVGAAPEFNN